MRGEGFTFTAPVDWTLTRKAETVNVADGKVDLVQVSHYTLEKAYRVGNFAAVAKELDGDASDVATQLVGKLAKSETVLISGRKTRYYEIEYKGDMTEEMAFVLFGKDEYQALCRRPTADADDTCAAFFASFALRGA